MTSVTSSASASLAVDEVLANSRDRPHVPLEACEYMRNWKFLIDSNDCFVSL